jgi:GT2 family glycosyltransferase
LSGSAVSVDVLVLCKTHPEYLERAIHHLDRQHVDWHGTLVDNSEDGRPTDVAVAHGWTCLEGHPDLNYAQSLNKAIAATYHPHMLWLSDDAYLHDGALGAMLEARKPIVSPLLLTSDGKVCFAGGMFNGHGAPIHVGRGSHRSEWGHATVQTDWITTPAALVRRDVAEAVGGLDEAYQWIYEDVDFCLAAADKGFGAFVCYDAVCTHDELGTKQKTGFRASTSHFFDKWQATLIPG